MSLEAYYPGLTDDVQDSLVSHYEFENDVTDSAGSNDGTDNTSAGFVNGIRGEAKDFDFVTGEHVDTGIASLEPPFTVSLWSKINSTSNTQHFISNFNSSGDDFYIRFDTGSGEIQLVADDGSSGVITSGISNVSTGVWYNYCAVIKSNGDRIIYTNGSETGRANAATTTYDSGKDFIIGNLEPTGESPSDGPIDDVRIYSKALSPAEVRQLYNWGRGVDFSGNENNGDVRGASAANGVLGETAFSFDGADDYLNSNYSSFSQSQYWTVSCWFNTTNSSTQQFIVGGNDSGTGTRGPIIKMNQQTGAGEVEAIADDGSTVIGDITVSDKDYGDGEWHSVQYVLDNTTLKLYIDGVEKASASDGSFTTLADTSMGIGARNTVGASWNSTFDGRISDVRIYNRVLSPSEISYLYEVGQQGSIRFGGKVL